MEIAIELAMYPAPQICSNGKETGASSALVHIWHEIQSNQWGGELQALCKDFVSILGF